MKVALRGSYIEYVFFNGVNERYPKWFQKEIYDSILVDEHRYTFWVPPQERRADYFEKTIVEDYTVFLRKPNGDIFATNYDVFKDLYTEFKFNQFTNSGIAAFNEDCIEYVECQAGVLPAGYPDWFYEYFTEAVNFPQEETIYFYNEEKRCLTDTKGSLIIPVNGDVSVTEHSVFLLNKNGEIRGLTYEHFLRHYDPNPTIGGYHG